MALPYRCGCRSSVFHSSETYEDDIIYPVHALDDTKTFRSLLFAWTLRFNDVLDANILCSALAELLDTENWRKIGGRLRLKADGKLEIHVPRTFSKERRSFSYSNEHFDMNIENHSLGKHFPKPNGCVQIWHSPQHFEAFGAGPNAPSTLQDLLCKDLPQISLHITTFTDATFIAIVWPHTLMDMIGQQAFLEAWSLILAGRKSTLPVVLGTQEDAIKAIVRHTEHGSREYALKHKQLRGLGLMQFGMRLAWDILCGPAPETRTICLTKKAVDTLRLQAQRELMASSGATKVPFISHSDVLVAWIVRAVAISVPKVRPITALHAVNVRYRLPAFINAPGVYLQNMVISSWNLMTHELSTGPLGLIALSNRQSLNEQGTEAQVLANLREQLQAKDPSKLLYSDADAQLILFTDWTKARLLRAANFGPAIIRIGDKCSSRSNPPGTPVFHHASTMRQTRKTRTMAVVLGQDYADSYWLTLTMSPNAWVKIKESLQELDCKKK